MMAKLIVACASLFLSSGVAYADASLVSPGPREIACDPAGANSLGVGAGCKEPDVSRGTSAAPRAEAGRYKTCQTVDGQSFNWSQPNVPFGAVRCDANEAPPKRAPQ